MGRVVADEDARALSGQRVATRGTTTGFQGLAVTATNKDDIESIAATGSAAGTAAITIAGDVNVITTNTTAEIANNAQINQNVGAAAGQSVLVAAGNDHYQMGIAGAASGGGTAGIGAGADVLVAKHTTIAKVGDSADVRARKDVSIEAHGNEAIYGGSYGWASAGRFHHAQSQVHRFLKMLGGYTFSRHSYSLGATGVIMPRVVGTHDDLMARDGQYASLFRIQAAAYRN